MKRLLRMSLTVLLGVVGVMALHAGGTEEQGTATGAAVTPGELTVYATPADYEAATGNKVTPRGEAPALAEKAKAGEIPKLADRLPEEPMVIDPFEGIGKYGGILKTGTIGPEITGFPAETMRWENLVGVSPDLNSVIPNIARGWELSEDKREVTFFLRQGMKWSDGEPFTADDFMFWYQDVILNDELTPTKPRQLSPGGELVVINKVDDLTVKFSFEVPFVSILNYLAVRNPEPPYLPAHYMEQFHPKYNPKADEAAKAAGYDTWVSKFGYHKEIDAKYLDTERPMIHPWTLGEVDSFGNKHYRRNPYYWKIDTAGNQLPYMDGITKLLYDNREVLDLKIVAGEIDIASRYLPLKNYTLYKKGEQAGGYRVILGDGVRGSECAVLLNQTVPDPMKREFFQNVKFKQAMSVAIDRNEINDLLFFGKAIPRQNTTLPTTSFYEDWMGEHYAQYDPDLAGSLLDEIGLDKKNSAGERLGPDGKPFTILLETGPWEFYPKMAEIIAGYWTAVGIKTTAKTISGSLAGEKVRANTSEAQLQGFANVSEFLMNAQMHRFRPPWVRSGYPWWQWWSSGGEAGEEPPEDIKYLLQVAEEWQLTVPGTEEYMRLGKELLEINVKGLYVIGTVGLAPIPVVFKDYVRNAPSSGAWAADYYYWTPYHAGSLYLDQ